MKTIQDVISRIEETFKRDDISTISRGQLGELVIDVYEDLTEISGVDWWERDEVAEREMLRDLLCVHNH